MADGELTFDLLFADSRQSSAQNLAALPGNKKLDIHTSLPPMLESSPSPMYPKAPYPTTTVTPVVTPRVLKAPWNYTKTLEEAFPDAEFADPENDAMPTLTEWLELQEIESPDEDYRLAVLFHDRLPLGEQQAKESEESYMMSGALTNDGAGGATAPGVEFGLDAVSEIEGEDEGDEQRRNEGDAEGNDERSDETSHESNEQANAERNDDAKNDETMDEGRKDDSEDEGQNDEGIVEGKENLAPDIAPVERAT